MTTPIPVRIPRRETTASGALVAVSASFFFLGVALTGLMTWYRTGVLEPRLRAEATAQAEILSQSQASALARTLRERTGDERLAALSSAVDELLLLRDAGSGVPYFEAVRLEIDHDALAAPAGSLDLARGAVETGGAFQTSVALYDPHTAEVLGLARFAVNSRLFRELSRRVGEELWRVNVALLGLLFVLWALLCAVLVKLERQTERRFAAERELSRQEKRHERLVNNLSQYFVYRKDARGRLVSVGGSVRRVLGLSPEEFVRLHADDLHEAKGGPGGGALEVTLADADGELHGIELSEVALVGEGGEVVAFDGIARDATAERRFREELLHAKEEAEAANRAKSHFLANMSHEIRTPLNAILGMAGLALRSVHQPRERDYLEKIRASARLLVEIIEDVLDLSRIEAGRLELSQDPFDLDDLLSEISDVIGVKAGARGIEVAFRPVGRLPARLLGDAVRLKQVLLNLLNNAVKFTESGEIVVGIEAVEVRRDRAALRFTVADTGIGIPAAHLPTLFEPFTQVDASNTRRYGGMGLGLAISRRLVRLMGGDIAVESRQGQGSTFTFSAAFGIAEDGVAARRLPADFTGLRALVVDDNESARLALAGMLETFTCRVDAAASGEEALVAFAQAASSSDPYRLAVLDWKMPGLDGIGTADALRQLAGERALGVVLVTAYDWEEAARRAEAAGIPTVLHKPLSPSCLHDALMLTLAPGERLRAATGGPPPTRFAPGQTVLLVEDQAINRELARELLTLSGLQVEEATNGREALAWLEQRRPDAVLMDVQMPDMDGLAAVGRIRADPKLCELPVIAMTAHAMLGDRERFLAAGMSDYVPKPIEEAQLYRTLARWLRPATEPAQAAEPVAPKEQAPAQAPAPDGFRRRGEPVAGPMGAPSHGSLAPKPPVDPAFDLAAGLARTGGNRALHVRLLRTFAAEAPELVSRLRAADRDGDRDGVRHALHALKGNAATVGATEVAALAAAHERGGPSAGSAEAFEDLARAVERARGEVPTDASEAPPAPASPPPLLDAGRLAALRVDAEQLVAQIETGSLGARRSAARLRERLAGHHAEATAELEAALERFDFESAARAASTLRGLLDEALEA